jgi:hypothetical protein
MASAEITFHEPTYRELRQSPGRLFPSWVTRWIVKEAVKHQTEQNATFHCLF